MSGFRIPTLSACVFFSHNIIAKVSLSVKHPTSRVECLLFVHVVGHNATWAQRRLLIKHLILNRRSQKCF